MMYDYLKREQELATGCPENPSGIGKGFDNKGEVLEKLEGATITEFPNAGSQSYDEAFRLMGYPHVVELQTCSSAGDWDFLVSKDKREWKNASQENRYPYSGFKYLIGRTALSSKEEITGEEAVEFFCYAWKHHERMHKFCEILGEADREELEEFLEILEKEIRLSDTTIEEGFEEG